MTSKLWPHNSSASSSRARNGFALPLILVFLVAMGILALALTVVFSGTGTKEVLDVKLKNLHFGGAQAGIERAVYDLKRPDNPGQAHVWNSTFTKTFTIQVGKEQVTVTIQDLEWPE